MKKILTLSILVLLSFLFTLSKSLSFEVVYPKMNDVTINSKSTFFIGSSDVPLKINGENVLLHESGGFAHVVNLKDGQNVFIIQSENQRKIYVINKPIIKSSNITPAKLIEYDKERFYTIITENTPLRSTPVDAGINRMAHLQRGVELKVNGEKNGFYRVVLGEKNYGWIAKTNVKTIEKFESADFYGYDFNEDDNFFEFTFHLNKKVPFEIVESDPMVVKFYNINNQPNNTYEYEFPYKEATLGKDLLGYSGEYFGNDFIFKVRKPIAINEKKPLKNIIIGIDAGHGGSEFGAIGCLGDKEKDINLKIAKELEKELKRLGAKVVMTREDDEYLGLRERVDYANSQNVVVLLSIHANALPDGQDPNLNSGTSIYYYYNQAKPLADVLINSMTNQLGTNNDKVRQGSLALVRNTNALSLLIEVAYLINPNDNSKLINSDFQSDCAKSIANGLEEYFKTYQKNIIQEGLK